MCSNVIKDGMSSIRVAEDLRGRQEMEQTTKDKYVILVVDDEKDIAEGICDFINFKCGDFFEALPLHGKRDLVNRTLEMVRTHKPDLAIIDLVLNGVDGVDLSNILIKEVPETIILYLTGCPVTDRLRMKADQTGRPTMLKPCDGREVVMRIKELLARK